MTSLVVPEIQHADSSTTLAGVSVHSAAMREQQQPDAMMGEDLTHLDTADLRQIISQYNVEEPDKLIVSLTQRSPVIANALNAQLVNAVAEKLQAKRLKRVIHIALQKTEEFAALSRAFAELNLRQVEPRVYTSHAYARASRKCDSAVSYDLLNINPDSVPASGYQFVVKEIGGHFSYLDTSPCKYVHACAPVLNFKDVERYHNSISYVENVGTAAAMSPSSRRLTSSMLGLGPSCHCRKLAQNCTATAKYLNFLHSSYDITIADIGQIFDSSKAQCGLFTFVYDARMHLETSGEIPMFNMQWHRFKIAGVDKIRFGFRSDTNTHYVHNFHTYTDILQRFYFVTPTARMFALNFVRYTNYTMVVRADLVPSGTYERQILYREIPLLSDVGNVVVHSWRYDQQRDIFLPATAVVPKDYWDALNKYILTLPSNKFQVSEVAKVAAYYTSRIVSGGTTQPGYNVGFDECRLCILASYFINYSRNYEDGMLAKAMKEDIDSVRSFAASNFGMFLARVFFRSVRNFFKHYVVEGDMTNVENIPFEHLKGVDVAEMRNMYIASSRWKITDWVRDCFQSPKPMFPIVVTGARVVSFQEELREICVANTAQNRVSFGAVAPVPLTSAAVYLQEMDKFQKTLDDRNAKELLDSTREVSGCVCTRKTMALEVAGDGDCFFHAFIRVLELPLTVENVKKRLLSSDYLHLVSMTPVGDGTFKSCPDAVRRIRDRIEGRLDPRACADCNVLRVVAAEFSVCICVHDEVTRSCIKYNPRVKSANFGTEVHVHYANNHYSPLIPITDEVFVVKHNDDVLVSDDPSAYVTTESREIEAIDIPQIDLLRNCTDGGKFTDAAREASRAYSSYTHLAHMGGYASFYGPMLSMVLDGVFGTVAVSDMNVLDVNQVNLSSTDALIRMGCKVSTLHPMGTPTGRLNPEVITPFVKMRCDFAKVSGLYDLICLNPCVYSDTLLNVKHDVYMEYMLDALALVCRVNEGGSLVMAIPVPLRQSYCKLFHSVRGYFDKALFVTPLRVPPHNIWHFYVLRDRNKKYFDPKLFSREMRDSSIPIPSTIFEDFVTTYNTEYVNRTLLDANDRIATYVTTGTRADDEEFFTDPVFLERLREFYGRTRSLPGGYKDDELPADGKSYRRPSESVSTLSGMMRFARASVVNSEVCRFVQETAVKFSTSYSTATFSRELLQELFPNVNVNHVPIEDKRRAVSKWFCEQFIAEYLPHCSGKPFDGFLCGELYKLYQSSNLKSEYDRKYCLSLAKSCYTTQCYPILFLRASDVGKPIPSTAFYHFLSFVDFYSAWRDVFRNVPVAYSPVSDPEPVPEFIDAAASLKASCVFTLGKVSPQIVEDDDTDSAIDTAFDGEGGYRSPQIWMRDAYPDAKRGEYSGMAEEYLTSVTTVVHKVTTETHDFFARLRPCIREGAPRRVFAQACGAHHASTKVVMNGKVLYEGEDCPTPAYVCSFELRSGGELKCLGIVPFTEKLQNYMSVEYLTVFSERRISESLLPIYNAIRSSSTDVLHVPDERTIVQAGPGTGKTHSIVTRMAEVFTDPGENFCVVVKNVEDKVKIREKLISYLGPQVKRSLFSSLRGEDKAFVKRVKQFCNKHVESIDNVLMRGKNQCDVVYVDEAMIHHPGKLVWLFHITKCAIARLYGDVQQIPYIHRVVGEQPSYPETSKAFPLSKILTTSYRCPADVCQYLSKFYAPIARDLGQLKSSDPDTASFKSASNARTPSVALAGVSDFVPSRLSPEVQVLTYTQADKTTLQSQLKGKREVYTVHEFQGREAPEVALVRLFPMANFETNTGAPGGISESLPHNVSALSRHTRKFTYYTRVPDDGMSKIIKEILSYGPTERLQQADRVIKSLDQFYVS